MLTPRKIFDHFQRNVVNPTVSSIKMFAGHGENMAHEIGKAITTVSKWVGDRIKDIVP